MGGGEGRGKRARAMGKRRPRPGPDPWIEVALNHFEGSTGVQRELVHVTNNRSNIDWIQYSGIPSMNGIHVHQIHEIPSVRSYGGVDWKRWNRLTFTISSCAGLKWGNLGSEEGSPANDKHCYCFGYLVSDCGGRTRAGRSQLFVSSSLS